jgi:archaellum component FlaD/FlaE
MIVVVASTWALSAHAVAQAHDSDRLPQIRDNFSELAERQAKETVEKQEALEKQEAAEKQAREAAERKQKEEQSQQAEAHLREETERGQRAERQSKEAEEREEAATRKHEEEAAVVHCVVPSLTGDSLKSARTVLHKAHCRLGRVTMIRGTHGHDVVIAQSVKGGARSPANTEVGVVIGPPKKRK